MSLQRALVRSIVSLLSLTLGLMGVYSVGSPAFAAEAGHISGTVTDPDGHPLSNILVTAYATDWWGVPDASVLTDASGRYDLGDLEPGAYWIGFADQTPRGFVTEYWDNAQSLDDATVVTVTSGESTGGVDAELAQGGNLTGAVAGPDGEPVRALVQAYQQDNDFGGWSSLTSVTTNDQGQYALRGLPAGNYRLGFRPFTGDYLPEYWDDAADLWSADDIAITAGESTGGKDAELAPAGHISGSVTTEGGEPIAVVSVTAYHRNSAGDDWEESSYGDTDANGHYDIGALMSGTYRLEFQAYSGSGYVAEFWENASSLDQAADITVTAGQISSGKDAQLEAEAQLTGTITGPDNQPLDNVSVTAYRGATGSGPWREVQRAWSDVDGRYRVRGLAAGSYRLEFEDTSGNGYLTEYWNNAPTLAAATTINVAKGQTTNGTNAELSEGGHLTGTVTGADGQPIAGASVTAYQGGPDWEDWPSETSVETRADGTYDIGGLATGDYRLGFRDRWDSDSNFLAEYWDNVPTLGAATDIHVTVGDTIGGKDARLTDGGHITGTVTGPDGKPVKDVEVRAYNWDAGQWDRQSDPVMTGADGRYDLSHLVTGNYRLEFEDDSEHGYLTEFWNDATSVETAEDIAVVVDQTTSGRDVQLGASGHIAGSVSGPDSRPLGDVLVTAYARDARTGEWGSVSSASTDANGQYDVGRLTDGTYRIGFTDISDSGFLAEYWSNATSVETADDIAVVAGQTVRGRDARLAAGGHITGTVTGPDGHGLGFTFVTAYRWDPSEREWTGVRGENTDARGRFDFNGFATGTYRMSFSNRSGSGYLTEFWDNASSIDSGTDITVTAGQSADNINPRLAAAGHITGQITGADNQPIRWASATAYRWDVAAARWTYVADASTDSAGRYDIGYLDTGNYRVRFQDDFDGHGYAPEYWDNATSLDTARDIAVTAGQTAPEKNAQLGAGGHVTGTVTSLENQPLADVFVTAYERDLTSGDWEPVSSSSTEADGRYDVGSLGTGSYRLRFDGSETGHLTEYWNNAATMDSALDIPVTAGSTINGKDAQLAEGGHITGTVTSPGGIRAEDVSVSAYQRVDDEWDQVDSSYTDANGTYDIKGLKTGLYRLEFDDESGHHYATEYWDDATSLETAADISVTAGATTTGKDAELATVVTPSVANTAAPTISGTAQVGSTLTASTGTWDPSIGLDFSYRWYVGGNRVTGATVSTYAPRADDVGKTVKVEVKAAKSGYTTGTATSAATASVTAAPSVVNASVPTITGTAQVGSTLSATTGTWNPSTDLTFSYRWLVGGAAVAGATASTYAPVAGDVGKIVQVEVKAARSGYTTGTATSAATGGVLAAAPPPPSTTPAVINTARPGISGTPKVGVTVTAAPGNWTPTGATLTYQWLIGGAPVAGATGRSYRPLAANAGKTLQVRVTAAATGHTAATVTSAGKAIGKGSLTATRKPTVSGKARTNATLTVSPGTWSPRVKVTYQWYAGTRAIPKATVAKLKLTGKTLRTVKGKVISVLLTITAPGYTTITTKLKVLGKVQ